MKRVKTEKQFGVRHSMVLAGLILVSMGAQASVTISAGSGITDRIVDVGSVVSWNNYDVGSSGSILIARPSPRTPIIQPPAVTLNTPSASSSVNGGMSYFVGSSSGSFNENDSSPDGSMVEIDQSRKGYGYFAKASAQPGQAKAHVETKWAASNSNGYGSSSANASSTWSDWFVISGSTGLGKANFSALLGGDLKSTKNGSAGYNLNIGYSTGAYCYWYNSCGEADQDQSLFNQSASLSGKGRSALSQKIDGEFTFEYDKAFVLNATLSVNATNGGASDFTLTSLGNNLELPVGSQLLSSSGLYVQAVPEAETYAMMLAGLGLVGVMAKRRKAKHS